MATETTLTVTELCASSIRWTRRPVPIAASCSIACGRRWPRTTPPKIVVYPAARKVGDVAARVADARVREEDVAKRDLAELEEVGPDGPGFQGRFATFRAAATAHAEAEERELFPILEQHCDHGQLTKMADRVRQAERLAPTHPHRTARAPPSDRC